MKQRGRSRKLNWESCEKEKLRNYGN
jgi:hypothetical protein